MLSEGIQKYQLVFGKQPRDVQRSTGKAVSAQVGKGRFTAVGARNMGCALCYYALAIYYFP